jgi:serine/threonine protein kinase
VTMGRTEVPVRLFDRQALVSLKVELTAEEAVTNIARGHLKLRPMVNTLFGLKTADGHWLAPNQSLSEVIIVGEQSPLEFRLRFKVPHPEKLLSLDAVAFSYYYHQVRCDFHEHQGEVIRMTIASASIRTAKWWAPVINVTDNGSERMAKETLYNIVTCLVGLNMVVAILEGNKPEKEVIKNASAFIPKNMWQSLVEKGITESQMKKAAEGQVKKRIEKKLSSERHKVAFLKIMEENFPDYYCECFGVALWDDRGGKTQTVRLVVKPPMMDTIKFTDTEPELEMHVVKDKRETTAGLFNATPAIACPVEEICYVASNIGGGGNSEGVSLEISRKNGIPLYLKMTSRQEFMSFVSHLSGYYRLCEKWIFPICNDIAYAALRFNMANNMHGTVKSDFVDKKFLQKCKYKPGYYILTQSCEKYNHFRLHYVPSEKMQNAPKVCDLRIVKTDADLYQLSMPDAGIKEFFSLAELVKYLKEVELIRDCLHPSEYDKSDTLLLCRSISKLRSDMIGSDTSSSANSAPKQIIAFNQLSRFETEKWEGKFTTVWKGNWQRSALGSKSKTVVAIKQLKTIFQASKLTDYVYMTNDVMRWDHGTLIKVLGTTLAARTTPMALITEFFPLGSLDIYLIKNRDQIQDRHLVEACTSLSSAILYLEEIGQAHGNVRCSNVFVIEHIDSVFKVKLGDPGLSTHYDADQVHWLPLELLMQEKPSPLQCSSKGDVWAAATTFWQIFNYGAVPCAGMDPRQAKDLYIQGQRLERPALLKTAPLAQIYRVMNECWQPIPELRIGPQALMKDMSELMYKVFNSKNVHSYMTIDNYPDENSTDTASSQDSSGTLVGSVSSSNLTSVETAISRVPTYSAGAGSPVPPESRSPKFPSLNETSPLAFNGGGGVISEFPLSNGNTPPAAAVPMSYNSPENNLVPAFDDIMRKLIAKATGGSAFNLGVAGDLFPGRGGGFFSSGGVWPNCSGRSDSADPLFSNPSRPGSSLHTDMSQFTSQTSLNSFSASMYSISSIYQISDSQLELNYENPLGEGNFGIVYLGTMTRANREFERVAVKMLKDSDASVTSADAQEEIRRELDIMKGLRHDNVVKIKAWAWDDRNAPLMIIMEYVQGRSLKDYLKNEAIEMPKQLFIYAQNIVEGMEYLGQQGIVHRDLAARNILVANEELVKISDFGLARTIDRGPYEMTSNTHGVPFPWMALECLTHRLYSFESDVWSFGVTLWEMFTLGEYPWLPDCRDFFMAGKSDEQLLREQQEWLQRLESDVRLPKPDQCPVCLYSEVMLSCWNRERYRRPTFTQLLPMLRRIERMVT